MSRGLACPAQRSVFLLPLSWCLWAGVWAGSWSVGSSARFERRQAAALQGATPKLLGAVKLPLNIPTEERLFRGPSMK